MHICCCWQVLLQALVAGLPFLAIPVLFAKKNITWLIDRIHPKTAEIKQCCNGGSINSVHTHLLSELVQPKNKN